jgi:hypothetical protein
VARYDAASDALIEKILAYPFVSRSDLAALVRFMDIGNCWPRLTALLAILTTYTAAPMPPSVRCKAKR